LKYNAVSQWARRPSHRLLAACAACLAVVALLVCGELFLRGPSPAVVETVTTGLGGAQANQPPAPVVKDAQLPERDEDVERAGDKIAEATVYLSHRQKAPALRALGEARTSARRAYERRSQQHGTDSHRLLAAMRELEQAESSVERGTLNDARQKLISLNRQLDQINQ
jgi:hypothetical protein